MSTAEAQKIAAAAREAATGDIQRHLSKGHDLNPYSTQGARHDWTRGFTGQPKRSYEGPLEFNVMYQRGKACAALWTIEQER